MSVSACDFADSVVQALQPYGLDLSPDAQEEDGYATVSQEVVDFIHAREREHAEYVAAAQAERDALVMECAQLEAIAEDAQRCPSVDSVVALLQNLWGEDVGRVGEAVERRLCYLVELKHMGNMSA